MRVAVGPQERGAQLLQRIRAERREGQQSADLEHTPAFGKHPRQIVGPDQCQVAPDEIERDAAQRQ